MVIITLPIFANRIFLVDESKIGLIILTLSSSAIIGRIASNYLLNFFKEFTIYLSLFTIFTLSSLAFYFVNSFYSILIVMPLFGASFGVVSTVILKIATEIVPKSRRAEGLGYFIMNMSLAMAIAPFIASLIYKYNYYYVFLLAFALLVIALLLSYIVKYKSEVVKEKLTLAMFFDKNLLPIFFISVFTLNGYGALFSYLNILADSRGIENASFFFILYSIFISLTRPIGGKIFDKYGYFNLMLIAFISLAFGLFLLSIAETLFALMTSSIFIGIGYGVLSTCFFALAIDKIGEHRKNLANSTIFISIDVGIGVGSLIAGIISSFSIDYIFQFSSTLILVALVIFLVESKKLKTAKVLK
jgi:predicted MFS family arabinose efflux permease